MKLKIVEIDDRIGSAAAAYYTKRFGCQFIQNDTPYGRNWDIQIYVGGGEMEITSIEELLKEWIKITLSVQGITLCEHNQEAARLARAIMPRDQSLKFPPNSVWRDLDTSKDYELFIYDWVPLMTTIKSFQDGEFRELMLREKRNNYENT